MPGSYDVYDKEGNLLSRTEIERSPEEKQARQDYGDLRALIALAQTPADEWTSADLRTALRALLRDRLSSELRTAVS